MDLLPNDSWATITPDFSVAMEQSAPGITQIVKEQQQPGENWFDALTRSLPILATTAQQAQILRVQADRAAKGLPPLDASQYGVGVQVGMSAETKQLLILGGVGVAALVLLTRKGR